MAKEKEIAIIVDTVRKIDLKQKQWLVNLKQNSEKGNNLQMKKNIYFQMKSVAFPLSSREI